MNSYAVFLRGINVGGINIRMGDLKDALISQGFGDAKTLLASGNVVLTSELEPDSVKQQFEECLRKSFGYDAWVVALPAQRLTELVEACPYPEDDKSTHTYVTLASDTAMLDELESAGAALDGAEQTRLGPEALAWLAPAGGTLESPFSKISSKARFKAGTTTRNLRTLIKVRDAAAPLS
ncbi:MAG TPA: DUF1697 domain-containing protein [Arthrobacter sp.]|jgi:uncharacterized protein (DUF1697 family)